MQLEINMVRLQPNESKLIPHSCQFIAHGFMDINNRIAGPVIANHYGVIRRAGYKVSGKSRSLKEWTPKLIRIPYNPIRTNDLTPKFFLI